jgi:hypothetical protein
MNKPGSKNHVTGGGSLSFEENDCSQEQYSQITEVTSGLTKSSTTERYISYHSSYSKTIIVVIIIINFNKQI